MIIDAAGERSEQGRFLSKSPGSSNAVLARAALDLSGQPREDEATQLDFAAGVVDINTDQGAILVVVEDNAFRDFPAIDARLLGQVDIKRVGFGIVVQLHGMNPRSGKALWIVVWSSSVTTLR